jgi:DNA-directed RNA polymerase subunit F
VLEYFGRLGGLGGEELDEQVEELLTLVGMTEWAAPG